MIVKSNEKNLAMRKDKIIKKLNERQRKFFNTALVIFSFLALFSGALSKRQIALCLLKKYIEGAVTLDDTEPLIYISQYREL